MSVCNVFLPDDDIIASSESLLVVRVALSTVCPVTSNFEVIFFTVSLEEVVSLAREDTVSPSSRLDFR